MPLRQLSDSQRRHLLELLDAPFWTPADPGEWSTARALERRGYLLHNPARGRQKFALTEAGRAAGEALRV